MKKILSLVLALSLLAAMCVFTTMSVSAEGTQWNGKAAAAFSGGGDGSKENPYKIGTAGELKLFANIVDDLGLSGTGFSPNAAACAVLTADIVLNVGDVSGCKGIKANGWFDWFPIGYYGIEIESLHYYQDPVDLYYEGSFDGAGHTISGVYTKYEYKTGNDYLETSVGLFGQMASGGKISNLGVVNSYILGDSYVGGVCGENVGGTITGCYYTGTVESTYDTGGVCGENVRGTITGCYNTGTVNGNYFAGGVCGRNSGGTITGCYNTGTVNSTKEYVGGVCGDNGGGSNTGTVTGCYYLDTCAGEGTTFQCMVGESKTEAEMKTQEFVRLLNVNGGNFALRENSFPVQRWSLSPAELEPAYTVTIPAEISLGQPFEVSAEVTILPTGKQVEIALTGTSGNDNAFTLSNGKTAELSYQVTDGSDNSISVGDVVLKVNPLDCSTDRAALHFSEPTNTIKYSGVYTGTVTFTAYVADAA